MAETSGNRKRRSRLGHESIKTTEVYAHFGEEAAIRMAQDKDIRGT